MDMDVTGKQQQSSHQIRERMWDIHDCQVADEIQNVRMAILGFAR
jgi:hypothetical protein